MNKFLKTLLSVVLVLCLVMGMVGCAPVVPDPDPDPDPDPNPPVVVTEQVIATEGNYTTNKDIKTVIVKVGNVTISNSTLDTLTIDKSVGDGNVTLDNVTVKNLNVNGGGENSIYVKGKSKMANVSIQRVDGAVRVVVDDTAEVEIVVVNDGSDNVILTGSFDQVEVASSSNTVKLVDAEINNVNVTAGGNRVEVAPNTTVNTIDLGKEAEKAILSIAGTANTVNSQAPKSNIEVVGAVNNVVIAKTAESSNVTVASGSNVGEVKTSAPSTTVVGAGKVNSVVAEAGANNAVIDTVNTEVKTSEGVNGVTANGQTIQGGTTASSTPEPEEPKYPTIYVSTFAELRTAIDNATANTTIILTKDLTHDTYVSSSHDFRILSKNKEQKFTIDLNGKILGCELDIVSAFKDTNDNNKWKEYNYNVDVTIINSAPATGYIGSKTASDLYYGIMTYGYDNLKLKLTNVKCYGYYAGIYTNGIFHDLGAKITATNCEFKGFNISDSMGTYLAAQFTYNFTDCKFIGGTAYYTKSGDHTLNNCTLTATGAYLAPNYNGNGAEGTGSAIMFDCSSGNYGQYLKALINGGTFTSANGYAIEQAHLGTLTGAYPGAEIKLTGNLTMDASSKPMTILLQDDIIVLSNAKFKTIVSKDFNMAGDLTIEADTELVINSGVTCTIPAGVTVTVKGTVTNNGTINVLGELVSSSAIGGTITNAAWDGTKATYGWYGNGNASAYYLYTASDFYGFGKIVMAIGGITGDVSDLFVGKTVYLGANIDLNNNEWTPIGGTITVTSDGTTGTYSKVTLTSDGTKTFKGTFDGATHSISNLKITHDHGWGGALFTNSENANFKNIALKDVNINSTAGNHAALVGVSVDSYFENVSVAGSISSYRVAGIVSSLEYTSAPTKYAMKNCSVSATLTALGTSGKSMISGGLIQQFGCDGCATSMDNKGNYQVLLADGCSFTGTLNLNTTVSPTYVWSGELFGATSYSSPATYYTLNINNFTKTGKIVISDKTVTDTLLSNGKLMCINGFEADGTTPYVCNITSTSDHYNSQSEIGRIHFNFGLVIDGVTIPLS